MKPLRDLILVEEIDDPLYSGPLDLTPMTKKEVRWGKVLAVSDMIDDLSEGDTIMFDRYSGWELEEEGKILIFLRYEWCDAAIYESC